MEKSAAILSKSILGYLVGKEYSKIGKNKSDNKQRFNFQFSYGLLLIISEELFCISRLWCCLSVLYFFFFCFLIRKLYSIQNNFDENILQFFFGWNNNFRCLHSDGVTLIKNSDDNNKVERDWNLIVSLDRIIYCLDSELKVYILFMVILWTVKIH